MTSSIGGAGSCQSTSGMQAWASTQRSGQKSDPSQLIDGLFAKIDTKKQGYIDQSELQSAFASLSTGTTGSDSDAAALFGKLDGDGDGKVTKTELSDGLQALASQLLSQLHQSGHRPPPPPGDDQGLTKEQLSAIAGNSNTDSRRASLMNDLVANFDAADADGDGKVTRKEAMSFERSQATQSSATTTADATTAVASNGETPAAQQQLDSQTLVQWLKLLQVYASNSQPLDPVTEATSLSVSA